MKIYCEKCKKVFEAEKPAEGSQVECPNCKEKVNYPETRTSPGAVIGGFVIERELSKGGMGEVYLARQISLDRLVALKVLQAKFLNDKEYVEAFFREARAAARINHPNVVQAYAVGEENGIFYFAMEYIRGKTMKEILKEKKVLDFVKSAKIIREVASALECAWRDEKLVHQDIKPDNIMLDANGFAKLADLGLARVAGINDKEASEGDEVLGTPQYISPEQLTGVPTDVRSDIYSLGATFYQFVTGRFPYVADTAEEIAKMHVAGHLQPPKEVNPDLPDELNTIIMKMMARNIEDRYQTPAPLIKALDMFLMHSQSAKNAVPHLNFRLPKAAPSAGGARPASPFGGGVRAPFGGGKSPFGGKGPGGGVVKAVPGAKPVPASVPKAKPAAAAAPAPAAKMQPVTTTAAVSGEKTAPEAAVAGKPLPAAAAAAPEEKPVAAAAAPAEPVLKAVPAAEPVLKQVSPAGKEAEKGSAKSGDDDVLTLKVVQKPEKKEPAPEAPAPDEKKGREKKGKKEKDEETKKPGAGKIVLYLVVCIILLGITLGCLGGVFYFLAVSGKLPESVKPFGDKVIALVKGKQPEPEREILPGDPFHEKEEKAGVEQKENSRPKEPPKPPEPPKPVTRPEYLAGIENLLQMRRTNPDDYLGFLEKSDAFFRKYPAALTPEENSALRSYLPIYNLLDERGRVAPAREEARKKFLAGLQERRNAEEAEKREAAAKLEEEKRRQAEAQAQARTAAEEKRRREAEEQEQARKRLAEIVPKLNPLLENAAESFFTAIRTGETAQFEQAISDLQVFPFPVGQSQEELALVNQVNSFCSDLPGEVKKIRAFHDQLATITPTTGSFSVETPGRDLVTIVGISPAGVKAVDGLNKPVPYDLADKRLHALVVNRLEKRMKLEKPTLYLDLLTGTFSDETAKAAAGHSFWKTYYKPFMTEYFRRLLSKASAAERAELEKRYGKLPEFQAAK